MSAFEKCSARTYTSNHKFHRQFSALCVLKTNVSAAGEYDAGAEASWVETCGEYTLSKWFTGLEGAPSYGRRVGAGEANEATWVKTCGEYTLSKWFSGPAAEKRYTRGYGLATYVKKYGNTKEIEELWLSAALDDFRRSVYSTSHTPNYRQVNADGTATTEKTLAGEWKRSQYRPMICGTYNHIVTGTDGTTCVSLRLSGSVTDPVYDDSEGENRKEVNGKTTVRCSLSGSLAAATYTPASMQGNRIEHVGDIQTENWLTGTFQNPVFYRERESRHGQAQATMTKTTGTVVKPFFMGGTLNAPIDLTIEYAMMASLEKELATARVKWSANLVAEEDLWVGSARDYLAGDTHSHTEKVGEFETSLSTLQSASQDHAKCSVLLNVLASTRVQRLDLYAPVKSFVEEKHRLQTCLDLFENVREKGIITKRLQQLNAIVRALIESPAEDTTAILTWDAECRTLYDNMRLKPEDEGKFCHRPFYDALAEVAGILVVEMPVFEENSAVAIAYFSETYPE